MTNVKQKIHFTNILHWQYYIVQYNNIRNIFESRSYLNNLGTGYFFLNQFDSISFGSEFPKCTEMETHRVQGKAKTITIDFLFTYQGE